jgi:putative phosphoribosyl transferase
MQANLPFKDRRDAGRQLAAALPALEPTNTVVVALPLGGVPVAEEICRARHLPLDLVFVRKIGAPRQPEVAIGAIVDGAHPKVTINHRLARRLGLADQTVEKMGHDLLPEIERRKTLYFQGRNRPSLKGKTVLVVDDGVATGATLRASLLSLGESGAVRIILALPTAPSDVLASFKPLADEIVCLDQPTPFWAVGAAYRSFPQTSDQEVVESLQRCAGYVADQEDG